MKPANARDQVPAARCISRGGYTEATAHWYPLRARWLWCYRLSPAKPLHQPFGEVHSNSADHGIAQQLQHAAGAAAPSATQLAAQDAR